MADSEKIEGCPYCGKACEGLHCNGDNCFYVRCLYCGYTSAHIASMQGAIERHNELTNVMNVARIEKLALLEKQRTDVDNRIEILKGQMGCQSQY